MELEEVKHSLLHLQISVHDAHGVQVVDRIQHLSDEPAGIHLRVEALLHDPVEELPSRHPGGTNSFYLTFRIQEQQRQ